METVITDTNAATKRIQGMVAREVARAIFTLGGEKAQIPEVGAICDEVHSQIGDLVYVVPESIRLHLMDMGMRENAPIGDRERGILAERVNAWIEPFSRNDFESALAFGAMEAARVSRTGRFLSGIRKFGTMDLKIMVECAKDSRHNFPARPESLKFDRDWTATGAIATWVSDISHAVPELITLCEDPENIFARFCLREWLDVFALYTASTKAHNTAKEIARGVGESAAHAKELSLFLERSPCFVWDDRLPALAGAILHLKKYYPFVTDVTKRMQKSLLEIWYGVMFEQGPKQGQAANSIVVSEFIRDNVGQKRLSRPIGTVPFSLLGPDVVLAMVGKVFENQLPSRVSPESPHVGAESETTPSAPRA